MPKITKPAVQRLNEAPVAVALFNGCFNVATSVAEFSRHKVELQVEVTHPLLAWQCGDRQGATLIIWKGSTGHFVGIPAELNPLITRMRSAATMTDEAAAKLSEDNRAAFNHAMLDLGFNTITAPRGSTPSGA